MLVLFILKIITDFGHLVISSVLCLLLAPDVNSRVQCSGKKITLFHCCSGFSRHVYYIKLQPNIKYYKLVQTCFVFTVARKFDLPTLDLKVYDESNTEVEEEVFEFLLKKQDIGVLEIC